MACDVELVASLLTGPARRRWGRAADLLTKTTSLWDLRRLTDTELRHLGLSATESLRVRSALALGSRSVIAPTRARSVGSPDEAYAALAPWFVDIVHERFVVAALDVKNRPHHVAIVGEGGPDSCAVDPRDVFRLALIHRAASVLVAHNHPSGDASPSAHDVALTRRLSHSGKLLGIPMLDHLIVADICETAATAAYFSFARDLLDEDARTLMAASGTTPPAAGKAVGMGEGRTKY